MPCRGPDEDYPRVSPERLTELLNVESLCCAIVRKYPYMFAYLCPNEWSKAGITREWAEAWWRKHLAHDVERRKQEEHQRKQEEHQREQEAKRAYALAKLSQEERDLLGIKER